MASMKKSTILQLAALVVTMASILSFKHLKKTSGHMLYGATRVGSSNCTLSTCFTSPSGLQFGKCHTVLGGLKTAFDGPNNTLWTAVTKINLQKCSGVIRHWTHTN